MSYDETAHVFWMSSQFDLTNFGKILGLTVLIPTEKGGLWIYSYATESDFNDYLPAFRQIIASVGLSSELVYKSRWIDNIPILGGIDWGDVGKAGINGAIQGALIFGLAGGIGAIFANSRRSKKK